MSVQTPVIEGDVSTREVTGSVIASAPKSNPAASGWYAGRVIMQFDKAENFPVIGLTNALYVDISTNCLYRWDTDAADYTQVGGASHDSSEDIKLSDDPPAVLGMSSSAGSSMKTARADHVHALPSAADVGASAINHNHNGTYLPANGQAADAAKLGGLPPASYIYVHPAMSGHKHIPVGGSAGQILGYLADGTAQWQNPPAVDGSIVSMCSLSGQIANPDTLLRNTTHNVDFSDIVNTDTAVFTPSLTDSSITVLQDGVYMIIADARAGAASSATISVITVYACITSGGITATTAIGLMYGATRYNNASGIAIIPFSTGDKLQLALNASTSPNAASSTWSIIDGVGGSGKLLLVKL